MKTKTALSTLLLAGACALRAAPLSETTAVLTQPEQTAPILTYLKAGTEPAAATDAPPAPAGWLAVAVPGPASTIPPAADAPAPEASGPA